jgi:hypothetical protein
MGELSAINTASVYNQVYHLQKPDYSRDVTEASSKAYVLVLLTSSHGTNPESRILIEIWRQLAQRFGDVKFCQIRADLCIEGYPEKNTPTVLIYKDGDIKKQIVTLRELRGAHTTAEGKCTSFAMSFSPCNSRNRHPPKLLATSWHLIGSLTKEATYRTLLPRKPKYGWTVRTTC